VTDHQPDGLEDRVRDAYQSAARTVHTLQRPSPMLTAETAGTARPVRHPRRLNALAPVAAAAAVIAVIAASVALPRLLTGSAGPGPGASAHYPPFQVVVTYKSNGSTSLQVESAATGHVVTTVAPPLRGTEWGVVAAFGDTGRFVVAAAPKFNGSLSMPTRLYSLTLSAHGTVAGLTRLPVPVLPGQVTSLAASADGRTVAYTLVSLNAGADRVVGVITGRTTRHWTIGGITRTGTGTRGTWGISVSSDGRTAAFLTQDAVAGDEVWVLPTGSAPGAITARARKVLDFRSTYTPGKVRWLNSAMISPDGRTLYLATSTSVAGGKVVTTLAAYPTAGRASPRPVTTFDVPFDEVMGEQLTPAGGGLLLAWNNYAPATGYLINPAARTRTTLPLHGIPRLRFTDPPRLTNVVLAW
jgi:hypothetical protein